MPRVEKQAYNEYMNDYMKRRYIQRRADAAVLLGGVCSRCSTDTDLDFHHIDPSTKLFTLSRGSSVSEARWNAEVAKCELLCKACHKQHHYSSP